MEILPNKIHCDFFCINCIFQDVKKKLIKVRARVNHLYFDGGWSKNKISRELCMSKHFVIKWTQSPDQDFSKDDRGWPRGQRRKWNEGTEQRIRALHAKLVNDPTQYYWGATAIAHQWRKHYESAPPPLRTIGQILKDLGLSKPRKSGRQPGAARNLCYPEHTVYTTLGNRVMEADFIMRRYLKGSSTPLHFVGFSAKQKPRLRHYIRLSELTTDQFIAACERFFDQFEKPDVLKLDNAATFIGSMSGKRNLSRTMVFLVKQHITPVFAVPRRPFTQASIEGNNSVFSRHFWKKRTFENIADLDTQLAWFNQSSCDYTGYKRPENGKCLQTEFEPNIFFLRQIHESESHLGKGMVEVLNEEILLPAEWINFFVIAKWNLKTETLKVFIEQDNKLTQLANLQFEINKTSINKLKEILENM